MKLSGHSAHFVRKIALVFVPVVSGDYEVIGLSFGQAPKHEIHWGAGDGAG